MRPFLSVRLTALLGGCLWQPLAGAAGGEPPAGPGLAAWFGLLVLSLLVVLVAALVWVSRQRLRGPEAGSGIDILGMRALGPREQLVVVRIDGRTFLVGHTSQQVNLVAELDAYTPATPAPGVAGFPEQLQRWLARSRS